ncbi:type IV secretion system protein VirB5 [Bradyrhizobium ottawaense]
MMVQRMPAALACLSVVTLLMASPVGAEIVFDPSVYARQFEQLTELKKQVDTLTSQLKVAQDQLSQAKQLYDSFNKRTNANDIGALLNTPQFRKVLPQQFSDIERLVAGQGGGNFADAINHYLSQNRAYAGNSGNSYYQSELDRIARQTGAKHSMGQAVYDTASQRIDALEELRARISSATDAKGDPRSVSTAAGRTGAAAERRAPDAGSGDDPAGPRGHGWTAGAGETATTGR